MPYRMVFNVDGGCRWNGQPNAIGAAAACLYYGRNDDYWSRSEILPDSPTPTSSRAELMAINLALEWALERCEELHSDPYCIIEIYSDSQFAVDCMTYWRDIWPDNGWLNGRGCEVAKKDLLEKAFAKHHQILDEFGEVNYYWIPREENDDADWECNEALDEKEDEMFGVSETPGETGGYYEISSDSEYYSSDDDYYYQSSSDEAW
ncbi:hypothetical protein PFICI_12564 [Pestalotiopsis fici W106-1]|uniref:RNase H type-1 domain-containing protein n=1 Tax=Pestalotiopsis fici (strain W106-1 / CGMCC3.15140) TaxID=1229662 RepID=W3WNY2_PESFW|nr:uncharacterized protein PFICI_12564 [Pestalotiopsis fici W106-1]ETS75620.1 hypothetical protein PFICI_12564 [Pestalotiopsis fici W106-1]